MAVTKVVPIPVDAIAKRIQFIRGQRVILDTDLAKLYGVETRALNQAIKRNEERFPEDFMFQLSKEEFEGWRSQIVMSNPGAKKGLRRPPYVFTEAGALQAASVLNSPRAIQVGIYVHRAFVQLRDLLATHKNIARQLMELEKRVTGHDKELGKILELIRELLSPPPQPKRRPIGFHTSDDD